MLKIDDIKVVTKRTPHVTLPDVREAHTLLCPGAGIRGVRSPCRGAGATENERTLQAALSLRPLLLLQRVVQAESLFSSHPHSCLPLSAHKAGPASWMAHHVAGA